MQFIDTHCHLQDFLAQGQLPTILQQADVAGVHSMIAIGTSPSDWTSYQSLAHQYPQKIHYSLGLHPCYVDQTWPAAIQTLKSLLANPSPIKPIAIGEIGLDHYHLPDDPTQAEQLKSWQLQAFSAQILLAQHYNLPIVIHYRGAFHQCLQVLDAHNVNYSQVIFHCFTEGPDEIKLLNQRGGRASFTGVITYKNAENVRQAALAQGLNNIIFETDSPYLAPHPFRGSINSPHHIHTIASFCATHFDIPLPHLASCALSNSLSFFNI